MVVDNQKVHDYIQNALDNHWYGHLGQRISDAFDEVNGLRRDQCSNLDLTAADHYLFCRWVIINYSPLVSTVAMAGIGLYDGVYKMGNQIAEMCGGGTLQLRTGTCPVSVFSIPVIMWAQTGIADGNIDCLYNKWADNARIEAPRSPLPYGHKILFS